ncbi:MAG: prepilin peptidase [Deltaproteobacteria bacterium]|jgi:leader peptidase (prepilin peptidase)/N-methyltransferase|nr:prepilin peptidase [Deltaproteobacteria bacterium]
MPGFLEVALPIAAFALGLALGSFLNVVIFRLPRVGLALDKPRRSFCPNCQAQISWFDNIPVFSWLFLRGRCRSCREPISWRYPLVELVAAFLSLYVFQAEGLTIRYFFILYFLLALTAIAFIDLELMVIPDLLVLPTILLGLILAVVSPTPNLLGGYFWLKLLSLGWNERVISLMGSIAGFALGFGTLYIVAFLYKTFRGRTGLGDGDPPLLGLIGVYLGWISIFPVLFLSTAIALMSVGVLIVLGRFPTKTGQPGGQPIPYGPFLVLAALVWHFFGSKLLWWYLGLFG